MANNKHLLRHALDRGARKAPFLRGTCNYIALAQTRRQQGTHCYATYQCVCHKKVSEISKGGGGGGGGGGEGGGGRSLRGSRPQGGRRLQVRHTHTRR